MNRRLFAEFYKLGIEVSIQDNAPVMWDMFGESVNAKESRNEYAFYFAKQCMSDMEGRNRKEWGVMNKLEHFVLYRIPAKIAMVFKPRKRRNT